MEGVGVTGLGSCFTDMPLDFSLCAPVIYFVCNQPGSLTFFLFGLRPYTLLQILRPHCHIPLANTANCRMQCSFSSRWQSSHIWKAGEGIPQVASPPRSPIVNGLRAA